jgi:hypothetical protein
VAFGAIISLIFPSNRAERHHEVYQYLTSMLTFFNERRSSYNYKIDKNSQTNSIL